MAFYKPPGNGKTGSHGLGKRTQAETRLPEPQQSAHAFRSLRLETFADPIEAGMVLLQAKQSLGHGHFLNWLDEHFPISAKSASRLMGVAQMFLRLSPDQEMRELLLQLESSALYELAAKSTSAQVEKKVLRLLKQGKSVRYADIRRLKGKQDDETADALVNRLISQLDAFNGWYAAKRDRLEPLLSEMEKHRQKSLRAALAQLRDSTEQLESALGPRRKGRSR